MQYLYLCKCFRWKTKGRNTLYKKNKNKIFYHLGMGLVNIVIFTIGALALLLVILVYKHFNIDVSQYSKLITTF